MNLHILLDEKFTEHFIEVAESNSRNNIYVCHNGKNPRYLNNNRIEYLNLYNIDINQYIKLNKVSRIYLHSMSDINYNIVNNIKKENVKLIWIFYGGDGYGIPRFSNIYDDKTLSYYYGARYGIYGFKYGRIFHKLRNIIKTYKYINKIKILKKIDYFAFWLPHDYKMINDGLGLNMKYTEFYYGLLIDDISNILEYSDHINTINGLLLGNNAYPSNNHIEGIDIIKQWNYNGKVFCPLSYPGNIKYKNSVTEYGKNIIGDNFIPIELFLKRKKYIKLLSKLDIGVFNSIRQQGAGNIVAMLVLGKIVCINPKNPLYSFFSDHGVKLFSTTESIDTFKLSYYEKENNYHIVNKLINKERMNRNYKKLLNL